MKKKTLVVLLFVAISIVPVSVLANKLEVGKVYRLDVTVENIKESDGKGSYVAARPSKFTVLDNFDDNSYLVRFIATYDIGMDDQKVVSTVKVDKAYLLPRKYKNADITKMTSLSISGPVSGPLIVPFKYMLDEKDLTGGATIGYYAGYSISMPIGNGNRIPITPFLSGGLSVVSDNTGDDNDNKSAFTWAAGVLIQNWANVNIGILYGEDRTGDDSWAYEGDGWISFMVGWDI